MGSGRGVGGGDGDVDGSGDGVGLDAATVGEGEVTTEAVSAPLCAGDPHAATSSPSASPATVRQGGVAKDTTGADINRLRAF